MAGIESLESQSGDPKSAGLNYYHNPERRKLRARNSKAFFEAAEALSIVSIGELPDMAHLLNHNGKRSIEVGECLNAQTSVALFRPGVEIVPDAKTKFVLKPGYNPGREDSRRQVFFGEIIGLKLEPSTTNSLDVAVSVIPDITEESNHARSLHEVAMYQHVASLDRPLQRPSAKNEKISTLDVLGVVKSETPGIYGFTITRFDPSIRTLDTFEWGKMGTQEVAETLTYAVDELAILHSNYVFHGDSVFRNIAISDNNQEPKVVDLELGGSLRDEASNIMKLSTFMSADFSSLAFSLDMTVDHLYQNENGLISPTDRFNFMHDYVLLPYFNRMVQLGITPKDPLWLAFENVVNKRLVESVGEQGYWLHV